MFIAPPSIALKTRELDDATVNNQLFGIVAYAFQLDNLSRNSCIEQQGQGFEEITNVERYTLVSLVNRCNRKTITSLQLIRVVTVMDFAVNHTFCCQCDLVSKDNETRNTRVKLNLPKVSSIGNGGSSAEIFRSDFALGFSA